ncbi:MAG: hypothetical protein JXR58_04425 [Bacteroidales bacterium]|nr:hypothetical protein [Bacteroidales bacterium]
MKRGLVYILLLLFLFSCKENNKTNTEISPDLPDKIKNLPEEIQVVHDPSEIYAVVYEKDSNYYIWRHKTSIISLRRDLQIVEFGSMNFINGNWILGNYTKQSFTKEHFEMWYQRKTKTGLKGFCTDGILKKGVEYVDNHNYSIKRKDLTPRNGLWYYIAKDSGGKEYMGYGRYKTIGKLKNN